MMNVLCDKLSFFVDGELDEIEAENFRHHLARCPTCEPRLHDLMQLELLTLHAYAGAQPARSRRGLRRWGPWVAGAAALAACALGVVLAPARPVPPEAWMAHKLERPLDARLSDARADRYRPYVAMRDAQPEAPPAAPLEEIARLEERGDLRGVASAYLVYQGWGQAEALLARLPPSPDRDNDRAVAALGRNKPEEALLLLREALDAQPDHPQALWNRGVALERLRLLHEAEESFLRVAGLHEPGWSRSATQRAAELREKRERQRADWSAQVARTLDDIEAGKLSPDEARRTPEVARAALWEAIRLAPSSERLKALEPLATALDALDGGDALRQHLLAAAGHDFAVREPLAREYRQLLASAKPPPDELVERLRLKGQRDLLLGALLRAGAGPRYMGELQRFAEEEQDARLRFAIEHQLARAEDAEGRHREAERRLLSALHSCQQRPRPGHCAEEE